MCCVQLFQASLHLDHAEEPDHGDRHVREVDGWFSLAVGYNPKQQLLFSSENQGDYDDEGTASLLWNNMEPSKELWELKLTRSQGSEEYGGRRNTSTEWHELKWHKTAWQELKVVTGFEGVDSRPLEYFVKDVSALVLSKLEEENSEVDCYGQPIGVQVSDFDHMLRLRQQQGVLEQPRQYGGVEQGSRGNSSSSGDNSSSSGDGDNDSSEGMSNENEEEEEGEGYDDDDMGPEWAYGEGSYDSAEGSSDDDESDDDGGGNSMRDIGGIGGYGGIAGIGGMGGTGGMGGGGVFGGIHCMGGGGGWGGMGGVGGISSVGRDGCMGGVSGLGMAGYGGVGYGNVGMGGVDVSKLLPPEAVLEYMRTSLEEQRKANVRC